MDGSGPISWFVVFAMVQVAPVALALGVLGLLRWRRGGWDLKDWVVAVGAVVAAVALIMGAQDLRAHYIDYVGTDATGTIVRKWISEGDDSTSYHVAVSCNGYQDDFDVSEGFYDSVNPPQSTPVRRDPDYPAEFVPKFRVAKAWGLIGVAPMVGAAALLELGVFVWVAARGIDRFRKAKPGAKA